MKTRSNVLNYNALPIHPDTLLVIASDMPSRSGVAPVLIAWYPVLYTINGGALNN